MLFPWQCAFPPLLWLSLCAILPLPSPFFLPPRIEVGILAKPGQDQGLSPAMRDQCHHQSISISFHHPHHDFFFPTSCHLLCDLQVEAVIQPFPEDHCQVSLFLAFNLLYSTLPIHFRHRSCYPQSGQGNCERAFLVPLMPKVLQLQLWPTLVQLVPWVWHLLAVWVP